MRTEFSICHKTWRRTADSTLQLIYSMSYLIVLSNFTLFLDISTVGNCECYAPIRTRNSISLITWNERPQCTHLCQKPTKPRTHPRNANLMRKSAVSRFVFRKILRNSQIVLLTPISIFFFFFRIRSILMGHGVTTCAFDIVLGQCQCVWCTRNRLRG